MDFGVSRSHRGIVQLPAIESGFIDRKTRGAAENSRSDFPRSSTVRAGVFTESREGTPGFNYASRVGLSDVAAALITRNMRARACSPGGYHSPDRSSDARSSSGHLCGDLDREKHPTETYENTTKSSNNPTFSTREQVREIEKIFTRKFTKRL